MVDIIVSFQSQNLSLFIRRQLDMHKARASLSGISDHLIHIKVQRHRTSRHQSGHSYQGLDGRREFIAEGSSRMQLDQSQLLRLHADAGADHGMVQMDTDGFGMNRHASLFVYVRIRHIRFNRHMRLTGTVSVYFHYIGSALHDRSRVFSLDAVRLIIDIRRTRMDLDGVRSHGFRRGHICGKDLQVDLYRLRGFLRMRFCIRADHSDSVAVLEYLFIAQNRAVPSVAFIGRECDQAGDPVLARHILVRDDLVNTRHLFRLGSIDAFNQSVGHLCLHQGYLQSIFRKVFNLIRSEIPASRHLCHRRRTRVGRAQDPVFSRFEHQVFFGHFPAQYLRRIHHRVNQRLVAGTPAEIAVLVEPVADFLPGGRRIVFQQHLCAHDEARRTESALGASVRHPCRLQRMQVIQSADPLDGLDLCVVGNAGHPGDAGAGHFPVHDNVAGSAVAFPAADLTAGQQKAVPEHLRQGFCALQHQSAFHSVDNQDFFDHAITSSHILLKQSLYSCPFVFVISVQTPLSLIKWLYQNLLEAVHGTERNTRSSGHSGSHRRGHRPGLPPGTSHRLL